LLLLIHGHFRRTGKSAQVAIVDEQTVKIPADPIILEITAHAIPRPAQFPLGGWAGWMGGGGLLPSSARSRARSEEHAG